MFSPLVGGSMSEKTGPLRSTSSSPADTAAYVFIGGIYDRPEHSRALTRARNVVGREARRA